ncbi:MAG TPA: endonuclease/exonuclease/phosphatase family protein, partial [Mycobacteriales bacterium]|nr:endonuclease/exonuclease/phosphatase family protein [Mycobacteriales bacterium]
SGTRIDGIQGATHISPDVGLTVADVPGVVTAVGARQFWMQDPSPDTDPATSEGITVFTSTAPTVAVGDSVTVGGSVNEFRPGGTGGTTNLTTTEIVTPTVTVVAHDVALPAATLVGPGGRVPPSTVIENDASGSVETSGVFDPANDGIDFWESMEGMRVQIDNAEVVGPTNSFGETPVVPAGSSVRTNRGGIVLQSNDTNPERVVVDNTLAATPTANVGDTLTGATVGVLDYGFGNFMLEVTATPTLHSGGLAREITRAPRANELAVATFNVENLSPADPQTKFDRLGATVVTNLAAPDLIAVEEIQDNDGPTDDGVVAADQTLSRLAAAIQAAGGPAYSWRQIDPVNDQDGGQPGGNIRVAFMFRTDRGLSFVDRPGGGSTTATQVVVTAGKPHLSSSPGRVDPTNAAWNASRKPLAGEFTFGGHTLFVIANHFVAKLGDQPLFGQFQPPVNSSETQRHQQATVVHGFIDQILAADPSADVITLGDLNDFDFSQTANILVGTGGMVDLPRTLPLAERYSYDFEGNSEVLDQILISDHLAEPSGVTAFDYDVVHVNSEFADQVSDHDPQVVRLTM